VSTNPTESGESALDPFHRYGIVKRLRNKPLKGFEGSDMWLRLHYAAKMGLITVKMEVPPDQLQVRGQWGVALGGLGGLKQRCCR
jgi:hypothetical protein